MPKRLQQYELTTSESGFDMPFVVFGKNKQDARRQAKKKLRKGERIISLERSYFGAGRGRKRQKRRTGD